MAPRKDNKAAAKGSTKKRAIAATAPTELRTALDQAEQLNNSGQERQIVSLLSPFESQYPFSDEKLCGEYNRLLGFGYAHDRKFGEAENMLLRGHQAFPTALDFLYGLTYARLSLRDYASALETGEAFLKLASSLSNKQLKQELFNGAIAQKPLLLNYLGICYQNLNNVEAAERSFKDAIAATLSNHMAYLNLATLYLKLNQADKASEVVQRGLSKCPQVQELRMLADNLKRKATISACLIVKNEEELLPACLESIRDWVDEIIVVDTGSTDRTMEIARSYGALIYEHPWEGSFSNARNQSLKYATKDWLFIIDADERVYADDVPQLMTAVNQPDADVITMNVYNVYEEHRDVVVFLPSHRFFRRELKVHYEGIVHNQLVVPETARFLRSGARIKHLGYGLSREKMQAKTIRTKALLEKQLADNPDSAFALFNYAQLLRSTPDGFHEEYAPLILKAAGRAIELTQPTNSQNRHIHLMCLDQLAWTHYFLGQYDQALEFSERALDAKSDYLDPILLRGYLYFKQNDLPKATSYFERYLTTQATYDPSKEMENIILVHLNARTDALFNLGAISELQGNRDLAKRYYGEVLNINEDYAGANLNLGRLLMADGQATEAETCLTRVVECGKATVEVYVGLSRVHTERGEALKAEQLLRKGLAEHSDHPSLQMALSELYLSSGRFDDATSTLESAWQRDRTNIELIAKLCAVLTHTAQYDKAISIYEQAVTSGKLTGEMLNDLGNCYFRKKDYARAEERYRKSLEMTPRLATAKRNLGITLGILHKSQEAIDLLNEYIAAQQDQQELYHVIADLWVGLGDYQQALANYERYLQKYPSDVTALCRLSDCYLYLGHKDSAILGYRRALELDPGFVPAQQRLTGLVSTADSGESAPVCTTQHKVR